MAAAAFLGAVSTSFGALLAARAAAGLAGALVLPLATAAAAGLAAPGKRGSAVAAVLLGMTLALLLAAPGCTAIGAAFGWRAAFVFAGVLAAVAAVLVQAGLPSLPGVAGRPEPLDRAALARLAPLWAATLLSFTAAFSLTSFMSPIAGRLAGAEAGEVSLFQMMIGVGSFAGILLGGRAADRGAGPRTLALGLGLIAVSVATVGLALAGPAPSTLGAPLLAGGLLLSATALFSLMPVVQSRLAQAAGTAAPLALAFNGSANYLGQAGGAMLGGVAITAAGLPAAPLTGALAASAGVLLMLLASRGVRAASATVAAPSAV
jgi:DHA1 family inner membrane transport protein